jgi:hypothetical protein
MMEWYYGLLVTILVGMLGALLHVIIPPQDKDYKAIAIKMMAAAVVSSFLFLFGMDPRGMEIPSNQIGIWFISIIALGYTSLEVLQKLLTKYSENPPGA